jgi:hypothetical protein
VKFEDAKRIADVLKRSKPDPVSGTVGERVLWGRLAERIETLCTELVPYRTWDPGAWREAAGMDPSHEE